LIFTSPSYGKLTLYQVIEMMKCYIQEEPKHKYKIVIGTDSQTSKGATIFVSAVVLHRVGKGARFFFQKEVDKPNTNLYQRIYKETEMSLQLVSTLKEQKIELLSDWPLEIHLDIGQKGETRKFIKELVAWVTSVGYVAKIKPQSYGASYVADRFTS
jgi:predicted RNase H-related nuclease YkuK (DUF458 family)